MKHGDISGRIFGRLAVLFQSDKKSSNNHYLYMCRCECGTEKLISAYDMIGGRTVSCGCKNLENIRLPYGEANFNQIYRSIKDSAKRRNFSFDLSKDQVRTLISSNCFYCQNPPSLKWNSINYGNFIHNTIDRMNNSLGYNVNNCVPCCLVCNLMKNQLSISEFINHIELLYNNLERIKHESFGN